MPVFLALLGFALIGGGLVLRRRIATVDADVAVAGLEAEFDGYEIVLDRSEQSETWGEATTRL